MTPKRALSLIKTGAPVTVTRRTHYGDETIVGRVTTPILIGADNAVEEVTVEGTIVLRRISGLPLPLEPDEPVTITVRPSDLKINY